MGETLHIRESLISRIFFCACAEACKEVSVLLECFRIPLCFGSSHLEFLEKISDEDLSLTELDETSSSEVEDIESILYPMLIGGGSASISPIFEQFVFAWLEFESTILTGST